MQCNPGIATRIFPLIDNFFFGKAAAYPTTIVLSFHFATYCFLPRCIKYPTKLFRFAGAYGGKVGLVDSDVRTPLAKEPRRSDVVSFLNNDHDIHLDSLSHQSLVR